jgi:hypothetical protein
VTARPSGRPPWPLLAVAALGLVAAVAVGLLRMRGSDPAVDDVRAAEATYFALRDAILQDDDEAFFALHSRRAREHSLRWFPGIRAMYIASPAEERAGFHARFHVTEKEFLEGRPEDLVPRMLPWASGWRGRKELFRRAKVRDVRIDTITPPDGGSPERTAMVVLEVPPDLLLTPDQTIPDLFHPTILLVKDPDGWRRRSFFPESAPPGPR